MEIKLTEEQSLDLYDNFKAYFEIIKVLNEEAYNKMHKYYNMYVNNKCYFFKPMKADKFFDKMVKGSSQFIVSDKDYKLVTTYTNCLLVIDEEFLNSKDVYLETMDVNLFYEVITCPVGNKNLFLTKVNAYLDVMEKYMSIPYVVDENMIDVYNRIKKVNLRRIKVLKDVGIDYEI